MLISTNSRGIYRRKSSVKFGAGGRGRILHVNCPKKMFFLIFFFGEGAGGGGGTCPLPLVSYFHVIIATRLALIFIDRPIAHLLLSMSVK